MSNQYPFSGNPYAQSQSDSSRVGAYHSDPHSTNPIQDHNNRSTYQDPYSDNYQDTGYSDPNHDNDRVQDARDLDRSNNEKLPAVGTLTSTTPYGNRHQSLDYSDRKGIWTREDKRAYQKRGVAAKIFRSVWR